MASDSPKPRCKAKSSRTGRHCMRAPVHGAAVCMSHGGAAPQVRRKAAERVLVAEAIKAFGLAAARDPERILAEIAAIAFLQIGDLYDENGQLLPISKMPPHVQAAIANPETVTGNVDKGDGQMDRLVRVRQWDKTKMLELLAKHHGLTKEQAVVSGEIGLKWLE